MKLITNSAEIKVTENEDGSKSFQGIGSEVGVENRNGIILTPNCIEFARERYPLLYEHGAGSSEVIGDAKVYYDLASNKYLTDFTLYDNAPNINKAVENGAFDSLSIAYYITDYTFDDNDAPSHFHQHQENGADRIGCVVYRPRQGCSAHPESDGNSFRLLRWKVQP